MSTRSVAFTYEVKDTQGFGPIPRPIAEVNFLTQDQQWRNITMVIDTGADITLLPSYLALFLGYEIDALEKIKTQGVEGSHTVYLLREMKVKIGPFERVIPVGFVRDRYLPPLLGRHQFLETFVTTLDTNKKATFTE